MRCNCEDPFLGPECCDVHNPVAEIVVVKVRDRRGCWAVRIGDHLQSYHRDPKVAEREAEKIRRQR